MLLFWSWSLWMPGFKVIGKTSSWLLAHDTKIENRVLILKFLKITKEITYLRFSRPHLQLEWRLHFSIYYSEYFPTRKLNRNLDYSNWQINLIWSRTQGYKGKLLSLNVNINISALSHLTGPPRYIRRQLDRIHQKVWQSTESTTMPSSSCVLPLWLLHCSLYLK